MKIGAYTITYRGNYFDIDGPCYKSWCRMGDNGMIFYGLNWDTDFRDEPKNQMDKSAIEQYVRAFTKMIR